MPAIVTPEFSEFETIDASVDIDDNGFASVRVSYYARNDAEMLQLLKLGKTCPLVSAGILLTAKFLHGSANTIEAGMWKVNLFWKGISAKMRLNESAVPTYRPIAQTAPIDTHYNFETFAGTPAMDQSERPNNAQFDDQGSFVRFPPLLYDGVTPNPKAGVKSYYQATLKVGEKRGIDQDKIFSESDWFSVGKISKPDIEDMITLNLKVPGFEDQVRNHLLTSVKLEDLGNGYAMLDREWDMSGPYGWDEDIYTYEDTGDANTATD